MSCLLLRLYSISYERPAPEFLPAVLSELRKCLPFNSAWWGLTTFDRDRFAFQASYVEGLPPEMDSLWLTIQEEDVIGHAVLRESGRTLKFAPAEVDQTPGAKWLAHRTGFRNVLCTQVHNAATNQNAFLALSRHDDSARFTSAERRFKELLMQHWDRMTTFNHAAYLQRLQDSRGDANCGAAVVDHAGFVHTHDARFAGLLKREWPNWRGPCVPEPLRRQLGRGDRAFQGEQITASASFLWPLALIELTPRSPLDDLTPRERAVAQAFVTGKTYKETARSLGMAPATARHHLRAIYSKLNVSNKAAIVRLIGESRPH